jgi:hypothetical protein
MCDTLMPPMPIAPLIAISEEARPQPHRGFVPSYPAATFGTYTFGVPVEALLSSSDREREDGGRPPWFPGQPPWVPHPPHPNLPEPDLGSSAVLIVLCLFAARTIWGTR